MRMRRTTSACLTFLLMFAVVGGTLVYGLYHRSDRYRQKVESDLMEFFGLPVAAGSVEPNTFSSRKLVNLRMWLPDKRALIFESGHTIWSEIEDGDKPGVYIDIHEASLTIDATTWEREDYTRVLRASLAQHLDRLHIQEVRFHDTRITWLRPDLQLVADGVEGVLHFDNEGRGQGRLTCHRLNQAKVTEPIQINATIDPHQRKFLPEVTLTVPTLPLSDLGLDTLVASSVTQGTFTGRIHLRQAEESEVELNGVVEGIRLEEFTPRVPGGPIPAQVDLTLHQAIIRGDQLVKLRFQGEVVALDIDKLVARWGIPEIGGTARLAIQNGRFANNKLDWIRMDGEWKGGSLNTLARKYFQQDGIEGRLRVVLNNLFVDGDGNLTGDIDVIGLPPKGKPGRINRALLSRIVEDYLGVKLPAQFLPTDLEFVRINAHLIIAHNTLRVLSADGPAGQSMVTLRYRGLMLPLLGDTDVSIPIQPWIDRARQHLGELETKWKAKISRKAPAHEAP